MTFGNPQFLWLLAAVVPAMLLFLWWSWRARQKLMRQFIQSRLLQGLIAGVSTTREKLRAALLVAAAACLLLALAAPQHGFDYEEVTQRGLDIVVAIDTSRSMLASDITPNRLARAKLAALDLMQQAKSDRLGLVIFAGTAFLQCPLTIDDAAFRQSIDAVDVNTLPQGGTAVAEAIDTALLAFKEDDNHKVLVLFTDGEDHDSGGVDAARRAARSGMRIFTVGIGSAEGGLLRVQDASGREDYVRDSQGNVVMSRLNESLLQEIARESGGFYLPLRGAGVIDMLYQRGLEPLPKSDAQEKWVRRPRQRFHWPLAVAIGLLIAEVLFPERKRERQKASSGAAMSKSAAARVTLAALLLLPAAALGSASSALKEYEAGRFDEALKEYERLLQKKDGRDFRLHFNAGAAAYRERRFDQASKHFDQALLSPDLKLQEQAYYNQGNTLFRLGEVQQDASKKTGHWQLALTNYNNSLKLNPQNADAKFNYEFVAKKLEELKQQQQQQQQNQKPPEPSEAAKKAKAEADAAVRRREYAKALEIMNTQLKQDPTTAYYSDYIQRLTEVTGVQTNAHR